jgi:hypothetical protein
MPDERRTLSKADLRAAKPRDLVADAANLLGDASELIVELNEQLSAAWTASAAAVDLVDDLSSRASEKLAVSGLALAHARIQAVQAQAASLTTALEAARHRVGIARTRFLKEQTEENL